METARLTWLKCITPYGEKAVANISQLTQGMLHELTERHINPGAGTYPFDSEANQLYDKFSNYVRAVTASIVGSQQSRHNSRNEVFAMMMKYGCPAFWLTFNPSNINSRLLLKLSGFNINLDSPNEDLERDSCSEYVWVNVSVKNPVAPAKYFHAVVSALADVIVGKRGDEGVFGISNGYYGTVETNQHVGLYLRYLVWVEGLPEREDFMKLLEEEATMEQFRKLLPECLDPICQVDIPDVEPLTSQDENVDPHKKRTRSPVIPTSAIAGSSRV